MSRKPVVSIIICTRNRAENLRQTLEALGRVTMPPDLPAELIVVDNASTDATADVIRSTRLPNLPVRLVDEPRPGKSFAYNLALATARGDIFLCTDDDVRPPVDWISGMCAPILSGEAHAVAGGIAIAPHLHRPWMQGWHECWLASTRWMDPAETPDMMVGANMAFSREVLAHVPQFDPELGPGALGAFEETLFSRQIKCANFRLTARLEVAVEHHFDPSRLGRANFLRTAKNLGRSEAYVAHHWEHREIQNPQARLLGSRLALAYTYARRGHREYLRGIATHGEAGQLQKIWFYRQYLLERSRPRRYAKHGLTTL